MFPENRPFVFGRTMAWAPGRKTIGRPADGRTLKGIVFLAYTDWLQWKESELRPRYDPDGFKAPCIRVQE
jgi:hypothetical protein